MLFDEGPKTDPRGLFDREQELGDFASSLSRRRAIMVSGIRRVGRPGKGLPERLRALEIYLGLRGTAIKGKISSQALTSIDKGLKPLRAGLQGPRRR